MADTYSLKNNAVRAAKKAIAAGTAPAPTYEIKGAKGGGFRIVWDTEQRQAEDRSAKMAADLEAVDQMSPDQLRDENRKIAAAGGLAGAAAAVALAVDTKRKAPKADGALAKVTALLQRPEGATVAEVQAATGWLPHTARAFISTKFRGRVTAEKIDGRGRVYRVPA